MIRRGGVTLRGTVCGTGPTVLLLHAGGERRRVWDPLLPPLAASGLRAVAYDLRGHGDSSGTSTALRPHTEDVRAMLDHERAAVVVGASLGGFAALTALAEPSTPHGVAGLVLVDVVPDPEPARTRAWLGERGLLRDPTVPPLVEDILGQGPRLLAIAAGIQVPILLVRGGRSALGDGDVDRLRGVHPRVAVTTVAGAGHLVARDAPTELATILVDQAGRWLTDLAAPG